MLLFVTHMILWCEFHSMPPETRCIPSNLSHLGWSPYHQGRVTSEGLTRLVSDRGESLGNDVPETPPSDA